MNLTRSPPSRTMESRSSCVRRAAREWILSTYTRMVRQSPRGKRRDNIACPGNPRIILLLLSPYTELVNVGLVLYSTLSLICRQSWARDSPASGLLRPVDGVLALLLRSVESESMARSLDGILLAEVSVKRGLIRGRQAPTTPSDDSTMGQYTVGVSASFPR